MTSVNKRLLKELHKLYKSQKEKPFIENDYLVDFNEENMQKVSAIIKAPHDSVYRHRFIRLEFNIPYNYPHSPPQVFFINHDAVRIHPNMYEDGRCCSTILNTWGDSIFEKWTSSMGIETILLAFHSFLDNHPYTYEPGGADDPSYTVYVKHQSWYTCLLRYLQYENRELFKDFMTQYLIIHFEEINHDLEELAEEYPIGDYYTRCFEIDDFYIDYPRIKYLLDYQLQFTDFDFDADYDYEAVGSNTDAHQDVVGEDFKCNICFDVTDDQFRFSVLNLECGHSFHANCLKTHIETNHKMCSMCRRELTETDVSLLKKESGEWIINPQTNRRIKIGGRTWQYLLDNNEL
jgi:ubiquitin-protein ligase